MLSSNPKSTSSQIISPAFRNSPLRSPPVNPRHPILPVPTFIGCHVFKEQLHRHIAALLRAFCEGFALCSLPKTRSSPFAKKLSSAAKKLIVGKSLANRPIYQPHDCTVGVCDTYCRIERGHANFRRQFANQLIRKATGNQW